MEWIYWVALAAVLTIAGSIYLNRQRRRSRLGATKLEAAVSSGLTEPPSLHPVVNPEICVGSGACVSACPEKALGFIGRKADLVNPTICIGHGACAASCPVEAITLVFGTERRGMDIPEVKPTFESNVPGIYIAGELGGMGLIGKSAEQGRQAIENIAGNGRRGPGHDVVIVGSGPAGITATLAAMERKLDFVSIEQEDSLGGTVYHYPRRKVVMTHPVDLPLFGKMKLGEVHKEALLEFWQGIIAKAEAPIRFGERLDNVEPVDGGYRVTTSREQYQARNVLLAIGRRGSPRKLGVPGEDSPHVVYRLTDPQQYRGQQVLVVGGGDSAIEAALALSEEADTVVTLSYRSEAFSRAKVKNRDEIQAAAESGRVNVMLESSVTSVTERTAKLEHSGQEVTLPIDTVIVCAGGIVPTGFLRRIGVSVETKHGTA